MKTTYLHASGAIDALPASDNSDRRFMTINEPDNFGTIDHLTGDGVITQLKFASAMGKTNHQLEFYKELHEYIRADLDATDHLKMKAEVAKKPVHQLPLPTRMAAAVFFATMNGDWK